MIRKIINNDIFRRAVKTFLQSFLASLVVFLNNYTTLDKKVVISALIGALASGLSAVMNYVIKLLDKGDEKYDL